MKLKYYMNNRIESTITSIYLYFKYRYDMLSAFAYLRNLNLNSKNLRILLSSRNSIKYPSFKYPVLNTSLVALGENLVGVARISNAGFNEVADICGRPIQKYRRLNVPLENGIIKFDLSPNGEIANIVFLHDIEATPNYEDPRIFFFYDQIHVVMTRVSNPQVVTKLPFVANMVVENIITKQLINLPSPFGKKIEKNWVPVEDKDEIILLYGSNPVTYIKIKANESTYEVFCTENKSELNVNNRTQVIKTTHPDVPYIRVVSKKFATRKYGYTPLHYFEILSESFVPIKLSRPFVFSSRKQEYCQGITLVNTQIYLTWSEQEKYNFIGSIEIEQVIKLFI